MSTHRVRNSTAPQSDLLSRVLAVKEQRGLLMKFILYRVHTYQEPTRKGTARGEVIGFSQTKYRATLMGLTNLSVKKTAAIVEVSYGLLLKWRTEDAFRQMIDQHHKEFVSGVLLPYLLGLWEEGRFFVANMPLPGARSEVPPPHTLYAHLLEHAPELSDLAGQSAKCGQVLLEHLIDDPDPQRFGALANIFGLLYVSSRDDRKRNRRQDALFWSKWLTSIAVHMLTHGTPSPDIILQYLLRIQRYLALSDWPEFPT